MAELLSGFEFAADVTAEVGAEVAGEVGEGAIERVDGESGGREDEGPGPGSAVRVVDPEKESVEGGAERGGGDVEPLHRPREGSVIVAGDAYG